MTDLPGVLESCRQVVQQAYYVRIDDEAVARRAAATDPAVVQVPVWPEKLSFHGGRDACANFVLLTDCLNFCFWEEPDWSIEFAGHRWTRFLAMLAGLLRTVDRQRDWLDPRRWADASVADFERIFAGTGRIPMIEERAQVLNETGQVLLERYDGVFTNLYEHAGKDALTLARLLAADFPSFLDVADYGGSRVAFLKRAQICATDLAALWQVNEFETVSGLERLTAFADYRLPQILRHWGLLRVSDDLAEQIEARVEVPAGSPPEVELRAATVVCTDRLAAAMGLPAWKLDYYLWERSHDSSVKLEHHRTRTVFY